MSNVLLANRLKELRNAHSINQDVIADYLGISRQSYSHFETGKRNPNVKIIYEISKFYSISADSLFDLAFSGWEEDGEYEIEPVSTSHIELEEYLAYMNNPKNTKKLSLLSQHEKDMVYYFSKITESDKEEMIEFAKIKARRNKQKK